MRVLDLAVHPQLAAKSSQLHSSGHQCQGAKGVASAALLVMAACLLQGWAFASEGTVQQLALGAAAVAFAATLLVVGWVHYSVEVMRGLALSTDLGRLFNPNESIHEGLYAFAGMLRRSYSAESCIIILDDAQASAARLYVADGLRAKAPRGEPLDPRLAHALLPLPAERMVLFSRSHFSRRTAYCRAYDCRTLDLKDTDATETNALASLLEAPSFMSIPLRSRDRTLGRVHVVSRGRRYRERDLRSLAQLAGQAGPSIENMQLVDRLSLTVATQERGRISRDLHDGTIQPYIGLKLGLEALRRRLGADGALVREVDELVRMAGDGITELRHYVGSLKECARRRQTESLVQGVRCQVRKFSGFYDVPTEVLSDGDIMVSAQLYDEVMQIVREALSNIRRHTASRHAAVSLRAAGGALVIEISNDRGDSAAETPQFHPRSIEDRVRELGGHVRVAERSSGETVVAVEIPL